MYALQPLLRIREMREDRASGELTAARQAVAAAEESLAARRRDLEEYEELDRKWREIRWQEEREKVRAASESAEERDEDDSR